jgi:DNA-binding PadR family transcriptional regulator
MGAHAMHPFHPRGGNPRLGLRAMGGRGRRHFGPEGPGGRGEFGPEGPGRPGGFGPGPGDVMFWRQAFQHFGGFPGGPRGRGRGRKARRGDVRTAALLLLAEEPRNGYGLMQEIEQRSDGVWRPSPGSVYPALQQLEDEGLIRSVEQDGRRVYDLTDAGRAYVAERPEGPAPWETFSDTFTEQVRESGALVRDVAMAFAQVAQAGSEAQLAEARRVLADTRRSLYRILADGDPEQDAGEEGAPDS